MAVKVFYTANEVIIDGDAHVTPDYRYIAVEGVPYVVIRQPHQSLTVTGIVHIGNRARYNGLHEEGRNV